MSDIFGSAASVSGGLTGLNPMLQLLLAFASNAEQKGLTEEATAENLKRYYEVLGNLTGFYDQAVPYSFQNAQQTYENTMRAAPQMSALLSSKMRGGWGPDPSSPQFYEQFRTTMPQSPGPYVHGGGVPPERFNPSPRDQALLARTRGGAQGGGADQGGGGGAAPSWINTPGRELGFQLGQWVRNLLFPQQQQQAPPPPQPPPAQPQQGQNLAYRTRGGR